MTRRDYRMVRQLLFTTRTHSSSNSGVTSAATERLQALLQRRAPPRSDEATHLVPPGSGRSGGNDTIRHAYQQADPGPLTRTSPSGTRIPPVGALPPLGRSEARHPPGPTPPRFTSLRASPQSNVPHQPRESVNLSSRLGPLRTASPSTSSNLPPMGGENRLRQHLAQIAKQRTMSPSSSTTTSPTNSDADGSAAASGSIMQSLSKLREQFLSGRPRSTTAPPTAPPNVPLPTPQVSRFSVPNSFHRNAKSPYQQMSFKRQPPNAQWPSPLPPREPGLVQHPKDAPHTRWDTSTPSSRYTSPFTAAPEMPLSDIIKSMQLKNSAAMRQDPGASSLPLTSFDVMHPRPDIIPKWRQPGLGQNRTSPREYTPHRYSRAAPMAQPPRRQHKPTFVDPRRQTIVVPSFEISLTEASSLFRTKTTTLADLLRGMGENQPEGIQDDDAWMVSPDALGMLALELGLTFENAVVKHAVRDDDALLLKRRAASTLEPDVHDPTDAASTAHTPYESYPHRPPVVCIMGHVDHGKTTLMDALRRRASGDKGQQKTKGKKREKGTKGPRHPGDVAGTEAGGITQVISAFQVPLDQDTGHSSKVTFLDTPGHAAFSAMRQSGSDAADIIVLVVAADDGVSEQTVEILDFYKSIVKDAGSGGISLVVAMNKIDKPGVEVEESTLRIQSQLLEQGILTEGMPSDNDGDYGPAVQMIPVSGLTGAGLDDLIEGIALQSEIMDLRAPIETRAEGIVMDARVDKGVGIVADCIIRWGSIQKGDIVVSGTSKGKVRLLKDPTNAPLKLGLPSQPVRIVGFDEAPKAGEPIVCVESDEAADDLVARRKAAVESGDVASGGQLELQSSGRHMMRHEWKEALEKKYGMESGETENGPVRIPVVIKADADGTLAAIRDSLLQIGTMSTRNIVIEPVKLGVGPVLATEVQIAKECNAAIVCFNLKNEQVVTSLADENGVSILRSDVIYTLLDEAKVAFAKYLAPEPVELIHGRAKVQAVYDIGGKVEKVAGLMVTEGTLFKAKVKAAKGAEASKAMCRYRVLRDGTTIVESLAATSLKHFKEDVEEVARGKECGISLTDHNDFEKGDEIECFTIEMKHPTL